MTNLEKYVGIFTELFGIGENETVNLHYQDIEAWDSVGHMTLISEIEDRFELDMEADDIIDFESFETGKEILSKKYQIEF